MDPPNEQPPRRPVRLQIHPGHQVLPPQERQHVVAEHALRLGDIDLDAVEKIPQPLDPVSIPHERIKRAQQRPCREITRQLGVLVQVSRPLPTGHLDAAHGTVLNESGQSGARLVRRQSKIVADIVLGRHSQRLGRLREQSTMCLGSVYRRCLPPLLRYHPCAQVVHPFKAPTIGDRNPSTTEQPLQSLLGVGPVPTPVILAPGFPVAQFASGHRALGFKAPIHLLDQLRSTGLDSVGPPPLFRFGHTPPKQWKHLHREQGRHVSPVLEKPPFRPVGGAIDQRMRVPAQPRERRHVMRTFQDVNRIDLQQTGASQDVSQVAGIRCHGGTPSREALCRQRDATRLSVCQFSDHSGECSSLL